MLEFILVNKQWTFFRFFVGYGATCVALLLAATTILGETDKLPGNGGVLPPGACFAKSNLIANLCKNGYKFEVVSAKEEDESSKTE